MKIETKVIELMTGWQLQDLLSWFSTELTLGSGWNRFSVKLMPAKTSIKDFYTQWYCCKQTVGDEKFNPGFSLTSFFDLRILGTRGLEHSDFSVLNYVVNF